VLAARLGTPTPLLACGLAALAAAMGVVAGLEPSYALAAALGLAFAGVVFASLSVGFCLMAVIAFTNIGGSGVPKLLGAALALSWLAVITTRRDRSDLLAVRPGLTYALVVLVGWMAMSVAWAESVSEALNAIGRYIPNLLLIPIAFSAVDSRRHVVWVLATLAAAAAASAVLSLTGGGVDSGEVGIDRATGPIGEANQLAAGLVVGLVLAATFALRPSGTVITRSLGWCAVGLCAFGIFSTLSRGGLVALVATMITAVVVAGRWRGPAIALALTGIACTLVYFSAFASLPERERVTYVGGGSGRVDLWTVGGRMVTAEPLLGVGVGNFEVTSIQYLLAPGAIDSAEYIITTPKVAHNTFLQATAELGIPGGALFLGVTLFCLGCAWAAMRIYARGPDRDMEMLARGLFVALIGYFTAIQFLSENYSKLFYILLGLGPALLALARASEARGWTEP
jgi:O-antigen ligase